MAVLFVLVLLTSVYISMNKKIKDSYKLGWFSFLGIGLALYFIFGILL